MAVVRDTRHKERENLQRRIANQQQRSSKAKKAKKGLTKYAYIKKHETAKQREQRLLQNRERIKKWRQRVKENPETYENYLNAEKERYHKKKSGQNPKCRATFRP